MSSVECVPRHPLPDWWLPTKLLFVNLNAAGHGRNLKQPSKTDWARIDQMTDDEIDTSDIPPLDDAFFASAQLRVPRNKTTVILSIDDDVLKWFEAQGAGFQQRVNAALRIYAAARQEEQR
jgi:uncharacterized protein (DUF4415 family)